MILRFNTLPFLLLCLFSLSAIAQNDANISFPNQKVKTLSGLLDLSQTEADNIVFVYLSPECPLCQNYTKTLREIQANYQSESVALIGISPGTIFSKKEIRSYLETYDFDIPVILDRDYSLTKGMDASTTPEVFVFDRERSCRYHGAIDNWAYELGKKRPVITEHYLKDTLDHLLEGEKIETAYAKPVGCFIEF